MKRFRKKGAAMALLLSGLVVSSLSPVQAEEQGMTVSGNNPGMAYSMESGEESGKDSDAAYSLESNTVSGNETSAAYSTENGVALANGLETVDFMEKDTGFENGSDGAYSTENSTASGDGLLVEEPAGDSTVSGDCLAPEIPTGMETVSGSEAESVVGAGDSGGGAAGSSQNIADVATKDMGQEEISADGEETQNGISLDSLLPYSDSPVKQWNMGNSSGKYSNSYSSSAVFDDNILAVLYDLGNDTYRLELTGTGEMAGLGYYDYQPYKAYRTKIVCVTVGEGITNVGKEAFARFSGLQEYTLPATVKTIGISAFEYCTSLKSVVVPDTVESLSNYCFQECSGAVSLTIPGDLDYNSLYIPFYNMKNLQDIYITPGKTGVASASQMYSSTSSPASISDGYTIHFAEGITEISDRIFANTKASRIEIADSVAVIGADAFAKTAYDKTTIPDYLVLGSNTRSIADKAFMASVEKITPTTVEIGNVYQYEYDWMAVRREVTFLARLSALEELAQMVADDIQDGTVAEGKYPPAKWQELLDVLAEGEALIGAGSGDKAAITDTFIRLYDLYHCKVTASFMVSVPASVCLAVDAEGSRVAGEVPVFVKYLFPDSTYRLSVTVDEGSLLLQDTGTGRTLPLSAQAEGLEWGIDSSGAATDGDGFYNGTGKITLSGQKAAGSWEGTLRLTISCGP